MNDEIKYTLGGLSSTWDDDKAAQNRDDAVLAAMSVREDEIDCSDIPEISDRAEIRPAAKRFQETAKRNLAILNPICATGER